MGTQAGVGAVARAGRGGRTVADAADVRGERVRGAVRRGRGASAARGGVHVAAAGRAALARHQRLRRLQPDSTSGTFPSHTCEVVTPGCSALMRPVLQGVGAEWSAWAAAAQLLDRTLLAALLFTLLVVECLFLAMP